MYVNYECSFVRTFIRSPFACSFVLVLACSFAPSLVCLFVHSVSLSLVRVFTDLCGHVEVRAGAGTPVNETCSIIVLSRGFRVGTHRTTAPRAALTSTAAATSTVAAVAETTPGRSAAFKF